jgi:hypothetical protein
MAAPRPIASGDQFSYTGSLSETYTQSAPCAEPTASTSAQISADVSDTATTAPNAGSATQSTITETDAFPTYTSTTTTAQLLQISGSKFLLYSTTANDGTGNSITTSYNTAQEIDDLGTGGTWSNDPAANISEALSDGTSIVRTVASNGTYNDTQTFADGSTSTITTKADGSGVYDFDAGLTCNGEVNFAYAAPSGNTITLTITDYLMSNGKCTPATKTRTFPAWFAKAGNYITDGFSDNGSKPIPAACNVPSSIGTSGSQVVETYKITDSVLGYIETRTTTSYDVAGYGPACVTIGDELDSYYDYADDTTRIDYQSQNGSPNSVDKIEETIGMQAALCGSGSPPCAQVVRRTQAARPVSASAVAGRIAAIEQYRAMQRARRIEALHRYALRARRQGVVR